MRAFLPVLAVSFGLSLTIPVLDAASAADSSASTGTLRVALTGDIRGLEPGGPRDTNTDMVMQQVFEGLVALRSDLSVGPALAESWTVSDDGKTYTFKLRKDAKFHNGKPATAKDVVWSWNHLQKESAWLCRSSFDGSGGAKVLSVEAPDDETVVYQLSSRSGMMLKQMASMPCSVLVASPDSVGSDGSWTPIGTGPLKLKEWERGQYVTLERFTDYAPGTQPSDGFAGAREIKVDAVKFVIIPDPSSAELAIKSGGIDILPILDPDHSEDLKQSGEVVAVGPGLTWYNLALNMTAPALSNQKIRLAIAHAIDLSQLAASSTDGNAEPNPSAVSRLTKYYNPKFAEWPAYDPTLAAKLLKEAGYSGQEIVLQTNKSRAKMYNNAILVQAMLAAAGFNIKLEVLDWASQQANWLSFKYQMQVESFSPRSDPSTLYSVFLADRSKAAWSQWDDPKALALLKESMNTDDEGRRQEIFEQLHKMVMEQLPGFGLYFEPVVSAVRPNVKGFKTWPAGSIILSGVSLD